MYCKSESCRLSFSVIEAQDGQPFVKLDTESRRGGKVLTDDLCLYFSARRDVPVEQLVDLTALLTAAFDGLLCVVTDTHPMFKDLPSAAFQVH